MYCIGLNYAKHVEETGATKPGPDRVRQGRQRGHQAERPRALPAVVKRLDYEGELTLVLGPDDEIAGYTVANDVNARDLSAASRSGRAPRAPTRSAVRPVITTADEIEDPLALRLTTHVNGELRQDSTTGDLIFGPRELVDFIAETHTLEPGDLILTGMSGVGMALDPPRFLEDGDVVRIEIEELGAIEHPIAGLE